MRHIEMKRVNRKLLGYLGSILIASSINALAQDDAEPRVRIIEPDQQNAEVKTATIDTEKFELGTYIGNLAVEDFGSELVYGAEFSYHISNKWIVQATIGSSSIDRGSFEGDGQQFLAPDDRDFNYYGLSGGYKVLQGRSFYGARRKYDSALYGIFGIEQIDFAANSETGLLLGLSYRWVFTDWLTANVDFREHIVDRDFIGDSKQTFNTEFRLGLNALF
jgi:outer membrane beta-barrel protein